MNIKNEIGLHHTKLEIGIHEIKYPVELPFELNV